MKNVGSKKKLLVKSLCDRSENPADIRTELNPVKVNQAWLSKRLQRQTHLLCIEFLYTPCNAGQFESNAAEHFNESDTIRLDWM